MQTRQPVQQSALRLKLAYAVYKEMPWHLREQMEEAMAYVKAHPEACPSDIPVR